MKNKLFLMMLMVAFAIMMVACGSSDTDSEASATEPQETEDTTEVEDEGGAEEEATELTIPHELGETVVSKNPETVVVFDFGILDSLDLMGVDVASLPQANIPAYLEKYAGEEYVNAGSLKEPDFETISGLNPDLIIISGRQMELYDEFSKIGPTVFVSIDNANYMDSYKHNMRLLGEIFDQEAFVEVELAEVDEAIAAIQEKAADVENALVILANDGNISAYGPGSRFGIIHDVFGLTPADAAIEVSTHGMNVSFEYLTEKDPEFLFVVDRGAVVGGESSAQQILENDLTAGTRAFQNDNVIYLNPDYWYISGGGLTSVREMVKAIEEAIQ